MTCCFIKLNGTLCDNPSYNKYFTCRYHKRRMNTTYQKYLTTLHRIIKREQLIDKLSVIRHILQSSSNIKLQVNKFLGCTGWVSASSSATGPDLRILPPGEIVLKTRLNRILETYQILHPNESYHDNIWFHIATLIGQNVVRDSPRIYTTGDCLKFVWYTLFSDSIISRLII